MRKLIVLFAALASIDSYATVARISSLGADTDGSFYIRDDRNTFLNPAYLGLEKKKQLIFEWGDPSATDSDSTPRSEGGYLFSGGKNRYLIYVGREEDSVNTEYTALDANFLKQDNGIEFHWAFGSGRNIHGLSVRYIGQSDEQGTFKKTRNVMGAKYGFFNKRWQFHLGLSQDKAEGTNDSASEKVEGAMNIDFGFGYKNAGDTYYIRYEASGFEYSNTTGVKDREDTDAIMTIGWGRNLKYKDGGRLMINTEIVSTKNESKQNLSAATSTLSDTSSMKVPLTFAIEDDAAEWLTLRGSIKHEVYGYSENANKKKASNTNQTTVNGGATLKFRKFQVDGLIGATKADNSSGKTGVLSTDELMTRVGIKYVF